MHKLRMYLTKTKKLINVLVMAWREPFPKVLSKSFVQTAQASKRSLLRTESLWLRWASIRLLLPTTMHPCSSKGSWINTTCTTSTKSNSMTLPRKYRHVVQRCLRLSQRYVQRIFLLHVSKVHKITSLLIHLPTHLTIFLPSLRVAQRMVLNAMDCHLQLSRF